MNFLSQRADRLWMTFDSPVDDWVSLQAKRSRAEALPAWLLSSQRMMRRSRSKVRMGLHKGARLVFISFEFKDFIVQIYNNKPLFVKCLQPIFGGASGCISRQKARKGLRLPPKMENGGLFLPGNNTFCNGIEKIVPKKNQKKSWGNRKKI